MSFTGNVMLKYGVTIRIDPIHALCQSSYLPLSEITCEAMGDNTGTLSRTNTISPLAQLPISTLTNVCARSRSAWAWAIRLSGEKAMEQRPFVPWYITFSLL